MTVGLATSAHIGYPNGLIFDPAGDLLVSDSVNNLVRKIEAVGLSVFVTYPPLVVTPAQTTVTAGISDTLTITAYNPDGSIVTTDNDILTITSTDPTVSGGFSVQLVKGMYTIQVPLQTAGTQTITATDSSTGTKGTTPSITVNPAPQAAFRSARRPRVGASAPARRSPPPSAPSTPTATPSPLTTRGSLATDTDGKAIVDPTSGTFTSGLATITLTPETTGEETLTVHGVASGLSATATTHGSRRD